VIAVGALRRGAVGVAGNRVAAVIADLADYRIMHVVPARGHSAVGVAGFRVDAACVTILAWVLDAVSAIDA
jgi:hypothetical protein